MCLVSEVLGAVDEDSIAIPRANPSSPCRRRDGGEVGKGGVVQWERLVSTDRHDPF